MEIYQNFRKHFSLPGVIVVLTLSVVFVISFLYLTTYPRIWVDEAKNIEQAHNLERYGTPDVSIAPDRFVGDPQLLQGTGYPVTLPLAFVYKIFGYGFFQSRLFMLGWVLVALFSIYYFSKKLFGNPVAILSFILVATFASFYDNGRTVVGEIPGFVFLISGLFFLYKESFFGAGLFFGFAVVTKPSVFGILVLSALIALLLQRSGFVGKSLRVCAGVVPSVILWIVIVIGGRLSVPMIKDIILYYSNPFDSPVSANIFNNLSNFFNSTTLIYFSLLFTLILAARLLNRRSTLTLIYDLVLSYSLLAFIYYLRSPGWLRYILIAELLILMMLPHAVFALAGRFLGRLRIGFINWRYAAIGAIVFLSCLQLYHFATAADIYYSKDDIKVAQFINDTYPHSSVAVFDSLQLSVLLDRPNKYLVLDPSILPKSLMFESTLDPKPLLVEPKIDLMVFWRGRDIFDKEKDEIKNDYDIVFADYGYTIFKLKNH